MAFEHAKRVARAKDAHDGDILHIFRAGPGAVSATQHRCV